MLKRSEPWLCECESSCLQQELRHLDAAYKRMFENIRNKRSSGSAKNPYGHPRYKSRKHRQVRSYRITNSYVRIRFVDEGHICVPKLGVLRVRGYRQFSGRITGVTVKACASGRYELVLHVECEDFCQMPCPVRDVTGVDVGARKLAVASDGSVFENPKALSRLSRKIAREQRRLSRRVRGSANYEKCRRRLARLHERASVMRLDAQHKATCSIVRDSQVVVIESLCVRNMFRNHRLARTLSDAAMSETLRQLRYKCAWYGRELVEADMWFASSKTCFVCGYRNMGLGSVETWVCPLCGAYHDRDLNAARNLEQYGRDVILNMVSTVGRDTPEPVTELVTNACGESSGGGSEVVAA